MAGDGLWIGALGPLEVRFAGEPIAMGSGKQRAVLGILFVHAGRVVSTDRLIDELWGVNGSAGRQNALWVHISNLRKVLGSDPPVLVTRTPGYLLDAAQLSSDVVDFERLLAEGRALAETDPGAATVVVGEALELWRGRPYEDFTYDAWAEPEIGRLNELRMDAVELRIDCELRQGRAAELIGELEALVRQYPLRERLTGSLMLALPVRPASRCPSGLPASAGTSRRRTGRRPVLGHPAARGPDRERRPGTPCSRSGRSQPGAVDSGL